MPEVSRFYGIVITVNYRDHPPPHFHATYGDEEATVTIGAPRILAGFLPLHARRMVLRWAGLHRRELLAHWNWAGERGGGERPAAIPPLE